MFRKSVAVLVCAALAMSGCASAAGPRIAQTPSAPLQDKSVLADYVQRLPAGSRVRVERIDGTSLKGTLMKATAESVIVQKNTRVPEAPVEIRLEQINRITLDTGSAAGKTIGIGVAAGVAATFGVLLILAAIFSD